MVEQWINENLNWLLGSGAILLALLGAGFVKWGIQDWQASKYQQEDVHRILSGFTEEVPVVGVDLARTSVLARWWDGTSPRFQDVGTEIIPAITDDYIGQHASPVPKIIEEGVEEYVGKHRLPENLTARQRAALFTPTQGIPVLRTLAPTWREVVPA